MNDLTVIFTTYNKVPKKWAAYHREMLTEAIGDTKVISITKEPTDWGTNILQEEYGIPNLFRQMLRGAKLAETPYIAIAEDDMLYPREHFLRRPPMDSVAYDMNRWALLMWGEPFFFYKPSMANSGMIAPRELFIKAVEERFAKDPTGMTRGLLKEVGRNDWERKNRITQVKTDLYYAAVPFVGINHEFSVEPGQQRRNKKVWPVRAYEIPKWGRAEDVRKLFV